MTSISPDQGQPLDKSKLDYSMYLITARSQIHPSFLPASASGTTSESSQDAAAIDAYIAHLDMILKSGAVTMLQLREKDAPIENLDFLNLAKRSLEVCDKYKVPMLVNDNLSVALALPVRVGLHIGQTDLPLSTARQLLGADRLIGISAKTPAQAIEAREQGADYVGIGAIYGTQSKKGIVQGKNTLGPRGAAEVVAACHESVKGKDGKELAPMRSVLIGGINRKTAMRSLFGATASSEGGARAFTDGLAVISDIYANEEPARVASEIRGVVKEFRSACVDTQSTSFTSPFSSEQISPLDTAVDLMKAHTDSSATPPLVQTVTSHVSSTLSANVALCFKSSPIMSHQAEEAEDLARFTGGIVLNIGTIGPESRAGMKAIGSANNRKRRPIVLDPVGVGASAFRKEVVEEILNHTQMTLIKGNSAELSCLAGLSEVQSRGVDAGAGSLSDPLKLVTTLARRERCMVLLTGKTDYLTDGRNVIKCENGHALLGGITGSGCALGVALAAGMARACAARPGPATATSSSASRSLPQLMVDVASGGDLLAGALMGLLTITIASELAAENTSTKGPGTFIPAWLDAISAMDAETIAKRAKISVEVVS